MPIGREALLPRRALLRAIAALPLASAFQGACGGSKPAPAATTTFLTADEQVVLAALADAILPPDDTPGGSALGAVAFIERLLTAFDVSPPAIFAGGPFSGRQPFPAADGGPSGTFPPNDFATFLPLDRYNQAAWQLTIFGSSGVPGGGPNDAVLGAVVGYRDQVRSALAAAVALAGAPFASLTPAAVAAVYQGLDDDPRELLYDLVSEAAFSAPEYGGNPGLAGWDLCHFEGDVMPLGFSQFDPATGAYVERPDAPVSLPNPGPDPLPVTDATWAFVQGVVLLLGGKEFP